MAYAITLKLDSLDDGLVVRHSSSPDDAAKIAWQLLADYGLSRGIFRQGWVTKLWDSMQGEYETMPIQDNMVRGSPGTHPDDVEFRHCVVDRLTNDPVNPVSVAIYARSNFPFTPEPEGTRRRFEMTRRGGSESLGIAYVEGLKLSVVDEFAPVLKDAVEKARKSGDLDGLASLLEATLGEIRQSPTKKRSLGS